MGNIREGTQAPSEPTSQTRLGWVQKDAEEGPTSNRPGADVLRSYAGIHPFILSAKSVALPAASNGYRERSNPPPPLPEGAAGQADGAGGGMSPEAKAAGKAGG